MDGGGQFGDKRGVPEAVGTIGDFAGAVEDNDGGEGVDAEEVVKAVREDGGGTRFDFLEIRGNEGFVLIAIGGEEENIGIVAKFSCNFLV